MTVDAEATKLEVEVLRQADKIATLIIAWSDLTEADRDRMIDFLAYDSTDEDMRAVVEHEGIAALGMMANLHYAQTG